MAGKIPDRKSKIMERPKVRQMNPRIHHPIDELVGKKENVANPLVLPSHAIEGTPALLCCCMVTFLVPSEL